MWRVEGGSYVWVSCLKENELDLLYELTLSYRESDDMRLYMRMAVWIHSDPVWISQWYGMTGADL